MSVPNHGEVVLEAVGSATLQRRSGGEIGQIHLLDQPLDLRRLRRGEVVGVERGGPAQVREATGADEVETHFASGAS